MKKTNKVSSWAINNMIFISERIIIWQEQDWWPTIGDITFDANQAMKWILDDLRIYDGTMSEGRIEKIYKISICS